MFDASTPIVGRSSPMSVRSVPASVAPPREHALIRPSARARARARARLNEGLGVSELRRRVDVVGSLKYFSILNVWRHWLRLYRNPRTFRADPNLLFVAGRHLRVIQRSNQQDAAHYVPDERGHHVICDDSAERQ